MTKTVLVLGGYGTFGRLICRELSNHYPVIIAGRNLQKAESLANELGQSSVFPLEFRSIDATTIEAKALAGIDLLINACGPFQSSDYTVAKCCIQSKTHYIDLADGRTFVSHIHSLDALAKGAGVSVISGASTVPALSSAVIDYFNTNYFSNIHTLKYGITPGQKSPRGLATSKAILSYLGKPIQSSHQNRYGWQDLYVENYPVLGKRMMGNCDIPDLDLFPSYYSIPDIQFSAGMESRALHLGIWLTSWFVRWGLPINLEKHASSLLKLSHFFDILGTDAGGMHMHLKGVGHNNKALKARWYLIAKEGHGPHIPTIASMILTHKILKGRDWSTGAKPCMGMITLEEYLGMLQGYDIHTEYQLTD